jgi:hypothetical protein
MTAFYIEGRDLITERSRPVQFEGFHTLEPVLPGLLVPQSSWPFSFGITMKLEEEERNIG